MTMKAISGRLDERCNLALRHLNLLLIDVSDLSLLLEIGTAYMYQYSDLSKIAAYRVLALRSR